MTHKRRIDLLYLGIQAVSTRHRRSLGVSRRLCSYTSLIRVYLYRWLTAIGFFRE